MRSQRSKDSRQATHEHAQTCELDYGHAMMIDEYPHLPSLCFATPYVEQEYNSGSAPFPYAMECTVNTSTCDTPELIAQMDISGDAEAMDLDIVATTEDDGAVELVRIRSQWGTRFKRASRNRPVSPLSSPKMSGLTTLLPVDGQPSRNSTH